MQEDMKSNDQNSSWKLKLENETAFDGEMLNENAAWNKLYTRLHKPRRKKAAWYWMAAAALIAAVICAVIVKETVTSDMVALPTPVVQNKENKIPTQQPATSTDAVISTKIPIRSAIAKSGNQEKINAKKTDEIITAVVTENNTEQVEKDTILYPVEIPAVNTSEVAIVSPKAKLKVVHVNELGTDEQNSISKPGGDYSVIQFGINNNKSIPTAGKIGIQISTGKTSPSN